MLLTLHTAVTVCVECSQCTCTPGRVGRQSALPGASPLGSEHRHTTRDTKHVIFNTSDRPRAHIPHFYRTFHSDFRPQLSKKIQAVRNISLALFPGAGQAVEVLGWCQCLAWLHESGARVDKSVSPLECGPLAQPEDTLLPIM